MTEILEEIKNTLIKRKTEMFKNILKDLQNKKLDPISIDELEKRENNELKIKTGTLIDEIIGGGVPEGKSMMLYGELASGKTQTCLTCLALCPNGIIYIDTEGSFRVARLKEICKSRNLDYEEIKKKIIYFNPKTWGEQLSVLFSIPSPVDVQMKIDLIICDSISKHFRGIEFVGRENLQIKTGLIREFILALEHIAELHRAALIYTTQIYDTPAATPYTSVSQIQKPVGGRSAEHQPDIVIHYRKGRGNVRVARMMDSSWNALAERAFVLNEKGIDDIPEEASVYSAEEKRAEKFAKTQKQEDIVKREKEEADGEESE